MITRLRRYWQIADVLSRYGFGILISDRFPSLIRRRLRRRAKEAEELPVYVRIRLALEELGPTFIKFGQIMSTRRDLLPSGLIAELQKLQDRVAPLPFEEVLPVIQEYCPEIGEYFAWIDPEPLAAASLAQVHRATLREGGDEVVLKIQRPGIVDLVETDLSILHTLARRLEKFYPESRVSNPTGLVREFENQIRRELNFVQDGKNADRLRQNLRGFSGVKVPRIYWEHSGRRLLIMEYVEGVRVDDLAGIEDMGLRPQDIAERGFSCYVTQIFDHGFFHADPHPGNLLVTPAGELAFLDFGIFGAVRPERQRIYLAFLDAIVNCDTDLLVESMERLGIRLRPEDREMFKDEVYLSLLDIRSYELGEYDIRNSIIDLIETMRRYHIQVPLSLMRIMKVILMMLDIGFTLYPSFDFVPHIRPHLERLRREKVFSGDIVRKAAHSTRNAIDGIFNLPDRMNGILERLSGGSIELELVDTDIKKLQLSLDRSTDKLIVGMVTAAVVVGSSLILLAADFPLPDWIGVVSFGGYVAALIIGLYALFDSLSRRNID
ncbi:MAG: ABC1 kinase family protein [Methanoculleaceae archaeon]